MRTVIIITMLIAFSVQANEVYAPHWVPEHKKAVFIKFIKEANRHQLTAEEYKKVLRATPRITSCKIDGENVILIMKKYTMTTKLVIGYTLKPDVCEIEDGIPVLTFKEPSRFWEKTKDVLVITGTLGIGLVVGYFLK